MISIEDTEILLACVEDLHSESEKAKALGDLKTSSEQIQQARGIIMAVKILKGQEAP